MQICTIQLVNRLSTVASLRTLACLMAFVFLWFAPEQSSHADSGFINRAPLVKTTPEPSVLDKISTDLSRIIKSINELPDEVEENTVTAEPETPVEKIKSPVPAIAKPEKAAPVKVKTAIKKQAKEPEILTLVKSAQARTKTGYSKFSNNGEKLQNDTATWSCVEDLNSGLTWEVKSSNGGIRDKHHLYTWFNPTQDASHGLADGGRCKGDISCDTNAYVQAMNKQKLCGHDDWRLPTREEMQSLVYFDDKNITTRINIKHFPEAMASWYWTASTNKDNPDYAWYVLFRNGISLNDLKARPKHIRLVRADKKPEIRAKNNQHDNQVQVSSTL